MKKNETKSLSYSIHKKQLKNELRTFIAQRLKFSEGNIGSELLDNSLGNHFGGI